MPAVISTLFLGNVAGSIVSGNIISYANSPVGSCALLRVSDGS